uniref:(northern house mosquito) hypothetical protein n=1 Tax=Culex pipiens TaxID=7175 RepID=A0A8D8NRD5_CULPI
MCENLNLKKRCRPLFCRRRRDSRTAALIGSPTMVTEPNQQNQYAKVSFTVSDSQGLALTQICKYCSTRLDTLPPFFTSSSSRTFFFLLLRKFQSRDYCDDSRADVPTPLAYA